MTHDFYEISPGIFCHPQVMGGRPLVGKRRIGAWQVANYLLAQEPASEIIASWPDLTESDVENVRNFLLSLLAGRLRPPTGIEMSMDLRDFLMGLLQGAEEYPKEKVSRMVKEAGHDPEKLRKIEQLPIHRKMGKVVDLLEQSWMFVSA